MTTETKHLYNDAETWCKWYITRPHTQAYIYQIYNGEGNLHGMVASCLGYMWEHGDATLGIKAYYAYLQHEYGYVVDGVRNNPSRIVALDEALSSAADDIDLAERVDASEPPLTDSLWGESPWSLPSLEALSTTYKGAGALPLSGWLSMLPELEQEILLVYSRVGVADTMELLGVSRSKVKTVVQKVQRAAKRAA